MCFCFQQQRSYARGDVSRNPYSSPSGASTSCSSQPPEDADPPPSSPSRPKSPQLLPSAGAKIPRVKKGLSQFFPHHLYFQFCRYPSAFPTVHVSYNLSRKSEKSEFLPRPFLTNPRTGIKVNFPFSDTWKYFWFTTLKFTAIQVQINFVPRHTYEGTHEHVQLQANRKLAVEIDGQHYAPAT